MFDDSDEVIKTERTAARATDGKEEEKKNNRSQDDGVKVENVTHAHTDLPQGQSQTQKVNTSMT